MILPVAAITADSVVFMNSDLIC